MESTLASRFSKALHSCGGGRGAPRSGGRSAQLDACVASLSCLFWLESADALLVLLPTCRAWNEAARRLTEAGDLGVVLTFSGIRTLSGLPPHQRGALVKALARGAESCLFLDFSVASGHSLLHEVAVTTGRQLFACMRQATDLTLHLEAWEPPLGCFVVELCRLIARSGQQLRSLQLGGGHLHQRMRAFLASGWRVHTPGQASDPAAICSPTSSSSSSSRGISRSSSSSGSSAASPSAAFAEAAGEDSFSCEEKGGHGGGVGPGGGGEVPLPFVLPQLRRLIVEGFQLLNFIEAPQLEEHAVIITEETVRASSGLQHQTAAARRCFSLSSSGFSDRLPLHRYWGQQFPSLHPCLAIRFAASNCCRLRAMEVAGFLPAAVKSGLLAWVRGIVSSAGDPALLEGPPARAQTDMPAAGGGVRTCSGCVLLQLRETDITACCCLLPQVEALRVDDLSLLSFACPPRLLQLEVNVSNSGEWPLLLEYLRVYGRLLEKLTVWAEDLLPAWLQRSVHAGSREQGLRSCRVSTETLLLLSFLRLAARSAGGAPSSGVSPPRAQQSGQRVTSVALLGKVGLQHLTELTGPTCLLEELSPSSRALPALRCIDTWGDAARLQGFLYQQHNLHSVCVRGLTRAEDWKDEGGGGPPKEELPVGGPFLPPKLKGGGPCHWAQQTEEAPNLADFRGPGCLLKATLRCPLLKRLELTEQAELADGFLLAGGAPQLEVLLYAGRLTVPRQKIAEAASALRRLRVLHALVLDTATGAESWGVCAAAAGAEALQAEEAAAAGSSQQAHAAAGEGGKREDGLMSCLTSLEQLYVHRLTAAPQAFLLYLSAARRLRVVGLQRCEGLSLGAVVFALESNGFRRLQQDYLPNPACRAFASSLSADGLLDRFVILQKG
ncbi:hypothetical protein Efla_002976 [Eimeria flavescens]